MQHKKGEKEKESPVGRKGKRTRETNSGGGDGGGIQKGGGEKTR